MAQRFPNVAVIGATGNLGLPILRALSLAQPPFKSITALTRSPPRDSSIFPEGTLVKTADYTSHNLLVSSLTGIDALIFALGSAHIAATLPILDAAVEAGVKFVVPSEYGLDSTNEVLRGYPNFRNKLRVQDKLRDLKRQGKLDYTLVFVGLWIDYTGLGGFLVDVKGKKQEVWDGGEQKVSLTSRGSIATAIVGVLQGKVEGKTEVRVRDVNMSQRRLREICEEVVGGDGWVVTELDTGERVRLAREKFDFGIQGADDAYSFVKRGAALGVGSLWAEGEDDSAALGLKEWSEVEVREFVRGYVAGEV
ncbi:hypothetical protein GE09DRAFT_1267229 [Coniochaeta sp. 2T2.1]|nr:hypothetical protein GE09DRAFT_1267229 [Coniochaeta sp. 2T2.1]